MTINEIQPAQAQFLALAGEIAEMFSFNRSIGQLYGFLYLSPQPLALEEIAKACRMSKGNASIHLRTLENWEAVTCSWKPGTRKDYYSANTNLRGLAAKRLREGLSKRLNAIRQKLGALKQDPSFSGYLNHPDGVTIGRRMEDMETLLKETDSALSMLPELLRMKNLF